MSTSEKILSEKVTSGAIIFIDLDDYLALVRALSPHEEWIFLKPLYAIVENSARQFGFFLIRSFGDGFLLYAEGHPDDRLFSLAVSLLSQLRRDLRSQGVSYKAALVGGHFMLVRQVRDLSLEEVLICGATANLAGKKVAALDKRSIFCSWPDISERTQDLTFDDISISTPLRRNIVCELNDIENLSRMICQAPIEVELQNLSAADSMPFVTTVKEFVLETIKLADDKAKAVFAVSGALLVYLFNGGGWPRPEVLFSLPDWPQFVRLTFLVAAMVALLISSVYALAVLMPRMGTTYKGLVFFGSIQAWPSAKTYADEIMRQDAKSLERESAMHNYEISKVAMKKYHALNHALVFMAIGTLGCLIYLGLSWWLQPPSSS